jgi:hypothetical protein
MQNLNYFLVVCAAAATVCVVPMSHAQDTEAQAKARQALRQKLTQLDGSAPSPQDTEVQAKAREVVRKNITNVQPAVSQPVIAQPSAPSAPAAITMSPEVTPVDAQAIEKARQAVRQELDQHNSTSPDSPEVAKAREALRQKLGTTLQPTALGAQRNAQTPAQIEADKAEAIAQAERRAKRNGNLAPAAFQPIEAPALPISSDKQQRLAELLQKYRADQLTPEQYHVERAKILGQQ